jgi:transposase InsO family protein
MVQQFSDKANVKELCMWVGLSDSVYYYRPINGKRGRKPSSFTIKSDGTIVPNDVVIQDIRKSLGREFCCYGYQNITSELHDIGYMINHKKVYRIMDENNLLLGKVIRTQGKRQFVKHRKIKANFPLEYLCIDIKYVWVAGEQRNYYLLTVIDVYTRFAIDQIFQKSIRKIDVINLFRRINNIFGIKGITIRNDNGSQFIANDVKAFLKSAFANQEFTHVATPEENSYIEAFHSIVETEVIQRFDIQSYYDGKSIFQQHRKWYNFERKHGRIGRITPYQKWLDYINLNPKINNNFDTINKTETGSAGEQPVRNNLSNDDKMEGISFDISSIYKISLLNMP